MLLLVALGFCAARSAGAEPARVIVQFSEGSVTQKSAALPGENGLARSRAQALSKRAAVALRAGQPISPQAQVVLADGLSSEALAARLALDPDVEYAVPDQRKRISAAPNDPLYPGVTSANGPASGQWYLRAPGGEIVSAIDAESAWEVAADAGSVVVAVLDTGVRFEHPDLGRAGQGGNLLPGYDMIADVDTANDGDGRDADASDPGDWVSAEDLDRGTPLGDCDAVADSSWHGTGVAAIIAALTDNGIGMASVARKVRVLPVRVLGKCGGHDSDIIAGMRWAAGLLVPGLPPNPTPARVLNLSLGGGGFCNAAYRNAVAQILAAGSVIVASAGNGGGHAVKTPANCEGVIAIAGLRHAGTKVGFSDLGMEVALSAPGGNCVNIGAGEPCLYPILTASNSGARGPEASSYTDAFRFSVGTSFATPLVSGTAALMLSLRPSLSPAGITATLQGSSRPFPMTSGDPTVPRCTAPQRGPLGEPIDQLECLCTTTTCGSGMLDAGAAVRAAKGDVGFATVVEYYNASLDHYFITWQPDEIAVLDAGDAIRGWERTGETFKVWTAAALGTSPVCRYYIPPAFGDSHFYGRNAVECEATGLHLPDLVLEASRFMHLALPVAGACASGLIPVYRVFSNRADANHRYMTDRALRGQMVARGWVPEGEGPDAVVMCTLPD